MPPTFNMDKTIKLTQEEAQIIAQALKCAAGTFRRYKGMNIGTCAIHSVWPQEVETMVDVASRLNEEWDYQLY